MTRGKITNLLGSLAVAGPLAAGAWAGEKVGTTAVQLYKPEQVIRSVAVEEQAAPAVAQANEGEPADEAKEEEPLNYLMQQLNCTSIGPWLTCNGIKAAGWLAQGFTWNPDSPDNRFNFPMTFNDRSNDYQLNQLYVYFERPVNTEACCWDIGGRVDMLLGTDYYFTTSVGWETNPDGTQDWNSEDGPRRQFGAGRLFGIAVPQLYAEVYAPVHTGYSIKIGHFYTPVGYETVTSTGNFFYSHAFTHQYFEPFTHWGMQAETKLTKQLKMQFGVTAGWDTLDDASDKARVHGSLTWTSCDEKTMLFYALMVGEEPGLSAEETRTYQSIYMTHKICENLTSVTGTDLIYQDDGSINHSGAVDDAEAYSIYQYLLYDINKCWSAGVRFEASRDDDNLRIVPVGGLTDPDGIGGAPPIAVDGSTFYSLTAGLNWKPYEHVRVRPELRWDWSDFNIGPAGTFDDSSDNNQFTASFDVIISF